MKTTILILSLVIQSTFIPATLAAQTRRGNISTSQEIFDSKWNYGALIVKKKGPSKLHTKIFKRILWIEKSPVTLIDTNFIFLENPEKNEDPKKNELSFIGEAIKKSFGPLMTINGTGNSLTIEGNFEKMNRYIRVSLIKKNNSLTIITSFIRTGFYSKLSEEVNELHSILAEYKGEHILAKDSETTFFNLWKSFIISEAQAEGKGLNVSSLFSRSVNNQSSEGISYSLTNDAKKGSKESNDSEVDNDIDNNIYESKDPKKEKLAVGFNPNILEKFPLDVAKQIKLNSPERIPVDIKPSMDLNWAEANKLLSSAFENGSMDKLDTYSAAGAALGGVALSIAIQGVSEGISFLHELFTGSKKKKLEWDDFEKAMEVWDTKLNDLVKMEQVVDNYLQAFDFFEGKNIGNDYFKQLNVVMRDMRFDRDLYSEKFKDQSLDTACRKVFYNAADELDQKVKEYDKIIQFVSNNSLSINSGPNYFCSQLKELQRKILSAETQIQDLRLKILIAEGQYYGKQMNSLDGRDAEMAKVNGRLEGTLEEKRSYDKKVLARNSPTISVVKEQVKIDWQKSCLDGKNDEGKKIQEDLADTFPLFAYFKKRTRCTAAYAEVEEGLLKKRSEDSTRSLASEDELRRGLVLKANNDVEMDLSEEQMKWMGRIHLDAYCYQFAHKKDSEVPAKCSESPEILYSIKLASGSEKARAGYDSRCQQRYLSGLKKMKSP